MEAVIRHRPFSPVPSQRARLASRALCRTQNRHTYGMDVVSTLIAEWGDQLWTCAVLPIVVGLGLDAAVRSGVVQIRHLPGTQR